MSNGKLPHVQLSHIHLVESATVSSTKPGADSNQKMEDRL
jgi:hypothetical protein